MDMLTRAMLSGHDATRPFPGAGKFRAIRRTMRKAAKGLTGGAKPTLKTIAEISGLAVPTVSRALKEAPDIGKATRERVRRIADEIGYVPNRAGVRLRTGKTNVVSLVLSTELDAVHHTTQLTASIAAGLRDTPYHLIVTPYFPDEDPMRAVRYIVETRSADALILNQTEPEDPRIAFLLANNMPFATHGRTIWSDQHPYFDFDNEVYGRLGAQALIARRRRRLLLIAPPRTQMYAQHMIAGLASAAHGAEVPFEILDGTTSDDTADDIEAVLRARLSWPPTFDGIICGSVTAAIAAVGALEAAGLEIGNDVDLLSKEPIPLLKRVRRSILTMPEDVTGAGRFLARAAILAADEPDAPPMQRLVVPTADGITQAPSLRDV